jgi:acyl-ACP thioesterase
MSTFKRDFCITGSDVDPADRARVDAIAVMLQECAAHHADTWGMSIPALMEQGRTWVLARLAIELDGPRPAWKDEVEVETWSTGFRGHIAGRDYIVRKKASGEVVGRGSSVWFVIDLNTRRPVRLAEYEGRGEAEPDKSSGAKVEGKIELPSSAATETPLAVRASDLDLNGHVNNVRYLQWLYEAVPKEVLRDRRLCRLEIHYLGETRYPETVSLKSWAMASPQGADEAVFVHSVLRSDGVEAVRAKTAWRKTED